MWCWVMVIGGHRPTRGPGILRGSLGNTMHQKWTFVCPLQRKSDRSVRSQLCCWWRAGCQCLLEGAWEDAEQSCSPEVLGRVGLQRVECEWESTFARGQARSTNPTQTNNPERLNTEEIFPLWRHPLKPQCNLLLPTLSPSPLSASLSPLPSLPLSSSLSPFSLKKPGKHENPGDWRGHSNNCISYFSFCAFINAPVPLTALLAIMTLFLLQSKLK